MSFGKLLATGKSWAKSQQPGRYRSNSGVSLPKFISPKNPFARSQETEVRTGTSELPVGTPHPPAATVARVASSEKSPASATRASAIKRVTEGMVVLVIKLNPFTWLERRAQRKKPAIPRFNSGPVQGELSLEKVRVKRNDLSDADLELVAGRKPENNGVGKSSRTSWDQMAARVFGAGTD